MPILFPYLQHIIQTSADNPVQDIVETPHIPIDAFIILLLLTPTIPTDPQTNLAIDYSLVINPTAVT